jgi:Nif-specific regulatory protein
VAERLGDRRTRAEALERLVECQRRAAPAPARASDLDLVESVSRLLGSLSDPGEVARRAMEMAVNQFGAERGVLLLAAADGGDMVPMAEHGAVDAVARRDAVGYSRRVVARVRDSGGSLLITDAPEDPRTRSDSVVGLRLRSIVCVPMFLGGRVVGAVYLDDSRRPEAFSDADRGVLEGFAHLMALAIERSRGQHEVERVNERLVGENIELRREVALRFQTDAMVAMSAPMQRVMSVLERAAATDATVLMTGEPGTGKSMIARVLHHAGRRRRGPFVTVNCGAFPAALLESELFGILPHVATGVGGREGVFVRADGGTLFLDEIGEMPPAQQVALLGVLSNREVTPIGGQRPQPVDVRVIAATNQDARRLMEEGRFREDLYYRLSVIHLHVPPLRERKADIPALVMRFVDGFPRAAGVSAPAVSPGFVATAMQYDWPGNVRELENYVHRVIAMNPECALLRPDPPPSEPAARVSAGAAPRRRRLHDALSDLEQRMLRDALQRADGNQSRAARELGLTEQTLRRRLAKFGLDPARRKRRTRRDRRDRR